jgi:hypothetical protein
MAADDVPGPAETAAHDPEPAEAAVHDLGPAASGPVRQDPGTPKPFPLAGVVLGHSARWV